MSLTNAAARRLLNSLFGGASPNSPNFGALTSGITHIGAALDTGTPTEAGANFNEPSGDGYARVALSLPSEFANATDADPSVITNASAISFPEATGTWGSVTHIGFFTASSGGTLLLIAELTSPRTIDSGDILNFASGSISVSLD